MIAAAVLATLALAAPGPGPDPGPGARAGPVEYVAYFYWTKDRRDRAPVLCFVPTNGPRHCVRVRPIDYLAPSTDGRKG